MFDDQLEDRMLKAMRDAGVSEEVYWRAYARGRALRKKYQKRRPVAGFPFSLIELLLHSVLDATERMVEWLVRKRW
ncbi:hypothetical protein KC957_01985 [Candidatus Saccharibacteria bacterium]|nr:hypothetical protein [Candidatus Saccharibacteria bacterium]